MVKYSTIIMSISQISETLFILAIPFFQLLCIPLAVIGVTRLWCEEEGLISYDSDSSKMLSSEEGAG